MHFTPRLIIPAAAFVLAMSGVPAMAQQPQNPQPAQPQAPAGEPQQPQQSQQPMSVSGELVRVNMESKQLWVRSDDGEKQFTFNDDTAISGESENVEGLATMAGTRVTVEYDTEGSTAVATKIQIHPRAAEQPAPSSPQPQQ